MNRIAALALAAALVFGMSACDTGDQNDAYCQAHPNNSSVCKR